MRVRSARVSASPSVSSAPAECLVDLASNLDLIGQVELGIEILDDALLDPKLCIAERLAQRNLGEHPAGRRSGTRRRHRGRRDCRQARRGR